MSHTYMVPLCPFFNLTANAAQIQCNDNLISHILQYIIEFLAKFYYTEEIGGMIELI